MKIFTGLATTLALIMALALGFSGLAVADTESDSSIVELEKKIEARLTEMELNNCSEGLSRLVIEVKDLRIEGYEKGRFDYSSYLEAKEEVTNRVRWGIALDCAVANSADHRRRESIVESYVQFYRDLIGN